MIAPVLAFHRFRTQNYPTEVDGAPVGKLPRMGWAYVIAFAEGHP